MGIKPMLQRNKSNSKTDNLYILNEPIDLFGDKLVIDIKDVVDFCFCPYYYNIKYKLKDETNIRQLYDKSLHNTFYAYLRSLQEDKLNNTLEFLKYRWGKEWIKYKNAKDILITPSSFQRDSIENKRKQGIDAIFNFNDMMIKDKQFPIIIGHKYEIEILPNIILTGTLEYVRELTVNESKIIQVLQFISESNRFRIQTSVEHNLELIAMSYAFKELFNVDYFQTMCIDIMKKKSSVVTCTEKDYNLLKDTVQSVIMCIQNDIKCVSPDMRCFHCEYRNICNNSLK